MTKKIVHGVAALALVLATFLPYYAPVHAQLNLGDFTDDAVDAVAPNADDIQQDAEGVQEEVTEAEEAINNALEDPTNIEARKEAIIAADEAVLATLEASNSAITNSQYVTDEQVQQLNECNAAAVAKVETHLNAVKAASTQEELLAAHQTYLQNLNPEQIQACVMTAVALGIDAFLEASRIFLQYSSEYLAFLPPACLQNGGQDLIDLANQGLDPEIPQAEEQLSVVFADGTITPDEVAAVETLILEVYEVGEIDATVYFGITSGIELCAGA